MAKATAAAFAFEIEVAIVADNVARAVLLLLIDVAIVLETFAATTDTALIRVLTDVIAAVLLLIDVAIVADNV